MRKFFLLIGMFSMTLIMAQEAEGIQNEIDQNLWKPFKTAFNTSDGLALNSLYAAQVLRVTPNGIDTENKFKAANLKRFEAYKNNDTKVQLDFWLDSRKTDPTTSYEVGFYRIRLTDKEGTTNNYGQFHIVLEKLDGVWKITQDWDASSVNGKSLTSEDFKRQKPLDFE